ncbi:hypothetical protein ACNFH5_09635 [Pseudomonas sp. NY15435]|uniref:hypothetical protein n=1 Tax=Pseudomonas sp. NY15435 TaxID=3400358 RepID=UPI003A85094C
MLTPEQILSMTFEQLHAAKQARVERVKLNREGQLYAAGVATKYRRGGTKLRARRVGKTDWSRLRDLEAQERGIRAELSMLDEEIKRRAHAEETRA